jgi:hypothetical protein
MRTLTKFTALFDTEQLVAEIFLKKNGLIIDVIGPNEHLGGIGVGVPYTRTNGTQSANFHCISIPAHRDADLAGKLSQVVAKLTEMNVVVILGIHFPNLSKNKLEKLSTFFLNWFQEIAMKLVTEFSSDLNK